MAAVGTVSAARRHVHERLIDEHVLALRNGVPTNADRDSATSTAFATALAQTLCGSLGVVQLHSPGVASGTQGRLFAEFTQEFVESTLSTLLPEDQGWRYVSGGHIDEYAQYAHLREVDALIEQYPELKVSLGGDYIIGPDVVVSREPLDDGALGIDADDAERHLAGSTFLRKANQPALPLLHASVSCKWTLRSDRAQNARTEALNLIRNRKGRLPAIAVVTAEPLPSRLASLADGTGDIDRVYHVALNELRDAVAVGVKANARIAEQQTTLDRMIAGRRLADISDLPFDLAS